MKVLKYMIQNAMIISIGILIAMVLEGVVYSFQGETMYLKWTHLLSILVAGIVCAIPLIILKDFNQYTKKQLIIRIAIHFLMIYIIVMTLGYFFGWYDSKIGFCIISAVYFVVYIFVWAMSYWLGKKDEKEINIALDSIRDEE